MPKVDKSTEDKKKPNLTPILVVMYGFVFLCVGIIMIAATQGVSKIILKPETPRQAYLRISGETHTGLRLARLQDFAGNYVRNEDTSRARTARDALASHEQLAWAKLTQTLYSLKVTKEQKTQALTTYKSTWGIWNRQQELPTLLQATGIEIVSSANMFYAPNARHSKFANSNGETMLAGEIQNGAISGLDSEQSATKTMDGLDTPNGFDVQNPRIKFAKQPKYPRKAFRKKIEAVVTLSLFIDERGNVAHTELINVEAPKYENNFARASKRAAMGSKFYPKTVGGKPISSSGYLRKYTFTSAE